MSDGEKLKERVKAQQEIDIEDGILDELGIWTLIEEEAVRSEVQEALLKESKKGEKGPEKWPKARIKKSSLASLRSMSRPCVAGADLKTAS